MNASSDLDIYKRQNFGNRIGFGKRTALVIVDFTVGCTDPAMLGGGNVHAAMKRTIGLLEYFRASKRPVAHTRVVYADDGSDAGIFALKLPPVTALTESNPAGQIVPELRPAAGELVVRKQQPSAFYDTNLAAWLIQRSVDTLVVAGCTTSGCVRATVVDAISKNYRPIVARDCVGDRAMAPHEANLFDMEQKYADVLDRDQIVAELSAMERAAR
jgi:maleamate amidohydrolase